MSYLALLICLLISSHRFCISSDETSSLWVPTIQMCPDGSWRRPDSSRNAAEGQYIETVFVPFEESKQNKSVAVYLKSVGGVANAAAFGAEAWVSALFFRDAVKAVVANGVNGLTRANWLTAARGSTASTPTG